MIDESIAETALSAADEAAIAALLARAFDTDFGGRSFFMQRPHWREVTRDPGIVGHVGVELRVVRLGEALVTIAGIADVATDPGRRGQGIAGRLLTRALDHSRGTLARFALLFGDRPMYAAAGFRPAANRLVAVNLRGARTGGIRRIQARGLMVLPLGPDRWDADAPLDLLGHLF